MTDIKQSVTLGGLSQRIHIKTDDETKPVLLFLHGGPGVCNRHGIMLDHADLADTFTLVGWDQRGSGGSYKGATLDTLTVSRFVEDARELVEWLCGRFSKDKIFIIGGSWGSALGFLLANRYPEHIAALVGFGQFVNGEKNEDVCYAYTLEEAKKAGDEKAVKTLEGVGPPVMGMYKGGYGGMMKQRRLMMKYGGYSKNAKKRSYFGSFVVPMIKSKEYTLSEMIGVAKGNKMVLEAMWPEVGALDFEKDCTKFKVPVFIFDGRLDMNTPSTLVQPYFDKIEAPIKELVWFENSGHNPMNDESDKFKTLLRQRLGDIAKKEKNV